MSITNAQGFTFRNNTELTKYSQKILGDDVVVVDITDPCDDHLGNMVFDTRTQQSLADCVDETETIASIDSLGSRF